MDRVERADAVGREYRRLEERVLAWATGDDDVRGAVVLGSRAREDHPADEWADLDVVVATDAAQRLVTDRTWLKTIGEPWMSFVEGATGADSPELRVMFAGGFDVDFACMPLDRLRTASDADPQMVAIAFGRGCRILVDKDGLLHDVIDRLPEHATGPVATPPSQTDLDEVCADFWYHCVWTAKHLSRGETWWAKGCCDGYLKHLLQRMLEWHALGEGRDPWFRGRFLEEWADAHTLAGLPAAFARYDAEGVWRALDVTMNLFGDLSRRTAARFDLSCEATVEARARRLVARIRTSGSFLEAGVAVRP